MNFIMKSKCTRLNDVILLEYIPNKDIEEQWPGVIFYPVWLIHVTFKKYDKVKRQFNDDISSVKFF